MASNLSDHMFLHADWYVKWWLAYQNLPRVHVGVSYCKCETNNMHVHAYGASTLSWHVKNVINSAILRPIVMGLALINCVHQGACHT